jgi:hypothetical protein
MVDTEYAAEYTLADGLISGGDDASDPQSLEDGGGDPSKNRPKTRPDRSVDPSKNRLKDPTMLSLIPDDISECSLALGQTSGQCMSEEAAQKITQHLHVGTIDAAKSQLGCETERCVLSKMTGPLGADRVKREINTRLKVVGPTDASLLTNIHIDTTMRQWAALHADFFPYNFNMRNYASYSFRNGYVVSAPDTLATIPFADLVSGDFNGKRYRRAGCIINTDVYQGDGKHWMALYAETVAAPTPDVALSTVEFFNSSGNAPSPEWVNWLEKTRSGLELIGRPAKIVRVTRIRHQQSKSECGLYSLFYIWARLHGVPVQYFESTPIHDQLMFEFRQHLFEDPSRRSVKRFNWDKYAREVNIEWE